MKLCLFFNTPRAYNSNDAWGYLNAQLESAFLFILGKYMLFLACNLQKRCLRTKYIITAVNYNG